MGPDGGFWMFGDGDLTAALLIYSQVMDSTAILALCAAQYYSCRTLRSILVRLDVRNETATGSDPVFSAPKTISDR